MEQTIIKVEERTVHGKQVRQIRRAGKIPGVVYGHGMIPIMVQVDGRSFADTYRTAGEGTIVSLNMPDREQSIESLIHQVQRDAIHGHITHIDFLQVSASEQMEVEVPLRFVGEPPAEATGEGSLIHVANHVRVRGRADSLPSHIDTDISGLGEVGQSLRAGDLILPSGIELIMDREEVIASVSRSHRAEAEQQTAAGPTIETAPATEKASV